MPYFGMGEVSFTKNEYNGNLIDTNIRGDLNLTAPLPTSIKMDSTGITAYTTVSTSNFARLDYRGLYIQNGALDIRTGTSDQRGVVLNKNGLKGFKSDGAITFSLDTNGTLSLYNGGIDLYTIGTNRYRGVRLDADGLRGYNASGTETFNLKALDGSLTLNGGYLKIINGLKADQIESAATNKWDNAESNAKAYSDLQFAQANNNMISVDGKIRADLRLASPLPTNLLLNGDGITASTPSNSSRFARMDYRGLYVQGGAIDIRTNGSNNSRGVVLDSGGLKGYDNSGKPTFTLNSGNGAAYFSGEVFVGDDNEYTKIITNYIENYGSYVKTWGLTGSTLSTVNNYVDRERRGIATSYEKAYLDNYRQKVKLTVSKGNITMRRVTSSSATTGEALFYTDYGISTWENGSGSSTASGTIEFFSKRWNSTSGLTLYSSGNIGLSTEKSSTGGATIYLNSGNSNYSVIIGSGDSSYQWGRLKVGSIEMPDGEVATKSYVDSKVGGSGGSVTIGGWVIGSSNINSTYYQNGEPAVRISNAGNIRTVGSFYAGDAITTSVGVYTPYIGATTIAGSWSIGSTNLNSVSGAIKMGASTGNIVCNKVTESSMREKKKNINVYEGNAVDVINSASIKTYQYLNDVENLDIPYIGLILDEAPLEVVDTFGNGVLPAQGTWVSWKAIQELSADLNNEKAKNELLTEELNDLRADVEYIKSLLQN